MKSASKDLAPDRRTVRQLIGAMLLADTDLDAFCGDHFPDVQKRFTDNMDRVRKVNILLDHVPGQEVVAALRESDPQSFETHAPLLTLAQVPRSKSEEENQARTQYLEFCDRRYGHLHVAALESKAVQQLLAGARVQELYVEPQLLNDEKLVLRDDEEQRLQQELRSPDLAPTRRKEIVRRLGQYEAARWGSDPNDTARNGIGVRDLLTKHRCAVIVGTPGAGKTTLLRYLAWACAQPAAVRHERLGIDESMIPLWVALRDFAQARRKRPELSLERFITARTCRDHSPDLRSTLRDSFQEGTALVLLDALDEVPREAERRSLAQAICTFSARYPRVRVVTSTRPFGYQPISGDLAHLRIAPLSADQMRQLIGKRAAAIETRKGGADLGLVRRKAQRIAQAIEAHTSVAQLAKNPLLLVMICDLYEGGTRLPAERAQLYDRATSMLLERWNTWRSQAPGSDDAPPLPEADLRRALAHLALRQRKEQHPVLPRARLVRWLTEVLTHEGHAEPQARTLAEGYIGAASGQAGILDERGPGQFVFWHQTFEEYLAAVALTPDGAMRDGRLLARAEDPRFREVFQLALGEIALVQADPQRAQRLVRALLKEPPDSLEPILHQRLQVAATCVAEQSWIPTALANEILSRLAEALRVQPYGPLAETLALALQARPELVPTARLVEALVPIVQTRRFRYIGHGKLRQFALRVLVNANAQSSVVHRLFDELILEEDDRHLRSLAAVGLLLRGQRGARVLIELAPLLHFDQALLKQAHQDLEPMRAELEPLLRDWLSTYGPGLSETAAVLLVLYGCDDVEVIRQLLLGAEHERNIFGARGRNNESAWLSHLAQISERARRHLVEALKPAEPHTEGICAWLLRSAAEDSDAVLNTLVSSLGERPVEITPVLLALGRADERVVSSLRPLLRSPDPRERFAVCSLLLELVAAPDEEMVSALLSCLDTDDLDRRLRAGAQLISVDLGALYYYVARYDRRSIAILGTREQTLPCVIAALRQTLTAPAAKTRAQASMLLVLLDQVDLAVIDVLLDEAVIRDGDRRELWELVYPRLQLFRDDVQLRLAQQVGHADQYARRWARERLARLGAFSPTAVAVLLECLNAPDPQARVSAALVLSKGGLQDGRVERVLASDLLAMDRVESAEALACLNGSAVLDRDIFERLLAQLQAALDRDPKDAVEWVYEVPACITARLQRQPEVLEWLADALLSGDEGQRRAAHRVTLRVGPVGEQGYVPVEPQLKQLVTTRLLRRQEDPSSWAALTECAYRIDIDPAILGELYCRYLESADESVRLACAERLLEYPQHRDHAIECLDDLLQSPTPKVPIRACCVLLQHRLRSAHLVSTIRSWLGADDVQLRSDPFQWWFPDPTVVVVRSGQATAPQDPLLKHVSRALYEPDTAEVHEGRRLSVHAACWLVGLDEVDPALQQTLLGWLSHQHPVRKLYATYLLLRMKEWPPALEAEMSSWLDQADMRLRNVAVRLLCRRSATAARVDAALASWLECSATQPEQVHQNLAWIKRDRLFGKEVILALVASLVRAGTDVASFQQRAVVQELFGYRSLRSRLLAALRVELASEDERAQAIAAIHLYALGDATEPVLQVLARASIESHIYGLGGFGNPSLPDIAVLAQRHESVRGALRDYLRHPDPSWRRIVAAILVEIGDSPTLVAPVLRAELAAEHPQDRAYAARLLARLGLPEDRDAVIKTLIAVARGESQWFVSIPDVLQPIDEWPECREQCQEIYVLWMSRAHSTESPHSRQLLTYLDGKIDHATYRDWLTQCLDHSDDYFVSEVHAHLSQIEPQAPELLRSAVAWLVGCKEFGPREETSKTYLKSRGLLSDKEEEQLQHYRITEGSLLDEAARRWQCLAREAQVVTMMAELADPAPAAGSAAPIKLSPGQPPEVCDIPALVRLVSHRPTDTLRQRFARTWIFHWIRGDLPPQEQSG